MIKWLLGLVLLLQVADPEDFNPVGVREASMWDVWGPVLVIALLCVIGGLLFLQWKGRHVRSN